MSGTGSLLRYPRRTVPRTALRWAGRMLLPLLTRTELRGLERFPPCGPLLVVGNHIAAMEVVLMVVYAPWQMEMMGPGDLPPPPPMDIIARLYGYIPVNRGHADRTAMKAALDVLRQRGIVGIFPEGGVWDPGARQAKRGVAWLSHQANAPILPIGFGGVQGALQDLLRLGRPRLSMRVGELFPAVHIQAGQSRKEVYTRTAQQVMQEVYALIPEHFREKQPQIEYERFELTVTIYDTGRQISPPEGLTLTHPEALARLFHRPAVINVFAQDLHMEVDALQQIGIERDPIRFGTAIDRVLDYLRTNNPYFLTYRFGIQEGQAMERGLEELRDLCTWASERGYEIVIVPIRRYRLAGENREILESEPGQAHAW